MNILAIIKRLTASNASDQDDRCPTEVRILAYSEGKASSSERTRIETHLAKCDDCRELLAATIHETGETTTADAMSEKDIKQQAARVLAYIELDEAKRERSGGKSAKRPAPARAGRRLSYPRLTSAALVVSAVAVGIAIMIPSDSDRAAAGMAALRHAMKDERRNQPLISGDLPASRYSPKRGGDDSSDLNLENDLYYERALDKVKSADNERAPIDERHTLARVLLAKGGSDVRKALVILDQLEAAGVQSAELLNDLGVARLQLNDYGAAMGYFTRALQKSPGASEPLFNKALAEKRAGLLDEARQDWNQFIGSTSDEALKAEAQSELRLLR